MKCNSDIMIYALADPETLEIRYVGQSARGLKRPYEHWKRKPQKLSYVHKWCKSLIERGLEPQIIILEEWDGTGELKTWLDEREIFWIAKKRSEGCKLTNLTSGGGGGMLNPTDELRQKLSLAHKGKPSQWKGKTPSKESREKMRQAKLGKKMNDETKAKMSLSHI